MTPTQLPVFLINLDRDTERFEHMAAQLRQAGLAFERVAAVQGRAVPQPVADYLLDVEGDIASGLKQGEVGCYASHLVIHERILRENIGPAVLVLEDDLRIPPTFGAFLSELLVKLPPDWEIVRLSNGPKSAYVPLAWIEGPHEIVRYSKIPNNTGAYLINARGAARFLGQAKPRLRAVDEDMRRPWEHGMKTYGVVPPPVIANIFDSSIDAMENRQLRRRRRWRPKLFTGRTEGPIGAIRRIRYNMGDLGFEPWLRCFLRNLAQALLRRIGRRRQRGDYADLRVG